MKVEAQAEDRWVRGARGPGSGQMSGWYWPWMEGQVSRQLLRPYHTEGTLGSWGVDLLPQKPPGNAESPVTSQSTCPPLGFKSYPRGHPEHEMCGTWDWTGLGPLTRGPHSPALPEPEHQGLGYMVAS